MAVSWSDLLPVPAEYATPQMIESARSYAQALQKKSLETRPIYNKAWGGLNMMAQALGGPLMDAMANKAELSAMSQDAVKQNIGAPGGGATDTGYQSPATQDKGIGVPGAGMAPGTVPPGAPKANYMRGAPSADLAYAETPGGLKAQVTKSAQPAFQGFLSELEAAGAPIKDVGSYNQRKIAGTNIWSQHAHGNAIDLNQTGRNQVSPEFRAWAAANPDKLGEIQKKYNMVSGANFKSGGPDFGHWEWGGPKGGGGALAFNGEPVNVPKPGSPDATANALAAGGLGGATPPLPKSTPVGDTGAPPAGVFTGRPKISDRQMHDILASPRISQANKDAYQQMYLQQNAPVQFQGTGGTWTMGKDGNPYFTPTDVWNEVKSGDSSVKVPTRYNPATKSYEEVPMTGGPVAPKSGQAAPIDIPLEYAPSGNGMLGKDALPPEITEGASAGKAVPEDPTGMLNFAPPEGAIVNNAPPKMLGLPDSEPPAPPVKAGTAGKTAQYGSTLDALQQRSLNQEAKKKAIDEEQKLYAKTSETLNDVGNKAQSQLPNLKLARELLNNPNFIAGMGAKEQTDFERAKALLGFSDPASAAANEAFIKEYFSGQILTDMKVNLQGLGQVRVAEIELLEKAAAAPGLSKSASRLILDLMVKASEKAHDIGKIANAYQQGARLGADGKVARDKDGHPIVHDTPPRIGELRQMINKYQEKNPLLTDAQIKEVNEALSKGAGYGAPQKEIDALEKGYAKERPAPPKKTPGPVPKPTAPINIDEYQ